MESNNISGDTAPNLHKKVLKILSEEKRGKLLDVPAGIGNLSSSLKEMGFEVLAGDIDEKVFQPKDIKFQKVDLNEKTPYPDSGFDYIVCVEGFEHLENYYHLLREFARILKKGGKLIITTPNVLSVFSRLRYLLIGYPDFFGGYYSDESQFYTFHITPVAFPQLYSALKKSGFCLENITANRNVISTRKLPARLLLWTLALCSKTITLFKIKDDFMRKTLSSPELLTGEILILKCIRR